MRVLTKMHDCWRHPIHLHVITNVEGHPLHKNALGKMFGEGVSSAQSFVLMSSVKKDCCLIGILLEWLYFRRGFCNFVTGRVSVQQVAHYLDVRIYTFLSLNSSENYGRSITVLPRGQTDGKLSFRGPGFKKWLEPLYYTLRQFIRVIGPFELSQEWLCRHWICVIEFVRFHDRFHACDQLRRPRCYFPTPAEGGVMKPVRSIVKFINKSYIDRIYNVLLWIFKLLLAASDGRSILTFDESSFWPAVFVIKLQRRILLVSC